MLTGNAINQYVRPTSTPPDNSLGLTLHSHFTRTQETPLVGQDGGRKRTGNVAVRLCSRLTFF